MRERRGGEEGREREREREKFFKRLIERRGEGSERESRKRKIKEGRRERSQYVKFLRGNLYS